MPTREAQRPAVGEDVRSVAVARRRGALPALLWGMVLCATVAAGMLLGPSSAPPLSAPSAVGTADVIPSWSPAASRYDPLRAASCAKQNKKTADCKWLIEEFDRREGRTPTP